MHSLLFIIVLCCLRSSSYHGLGFLLVYFDYFLWCYLFEGVEHFSCKVIDGLIKCSAVENLFVIEFFFLKHYLIHISNLRTHVFR